MSREFIERFTLSFSKVQICVVWSWNLNLGWREIFDNKHEQSTEQPSNNKK